MASSCTQFPPVRVQYEYSTSKTHTAEANGRCVTSFPFQFIVESRAFPSNRSARAAHSARPARDPPGRPRAVEPRVVITTSGLSRRRRDGGEGTPRARCNVGTAWCTTSLGAAFLAVSCFVVLLTLRRHLKDLLLWLEGLDVLESTLLFAVAFIVVSFPWGWGYFALNLAAGYLYGFLHGLAIVVAGVLVGTLVAHFGCRWWFPGAVAVLARRSKTFGAVVRLLETGSGLKVIALARLTPIPFGLQNAMFSISRVPITSYLTASTVGLLPTQILNSYMGARLRTMEDVVNEHMLGSYVVLSLQFCISVALMLYVVRKARQELEAIASYGITNIAQTDGHTHPVAFRDVEDI